MTLEGAVAEFMSQDLGRFFGGQPRASLSEAPCGGTRVPKPRSRSRLAPQCRCSPLSWRDAMPSQKARRGCTLSSTSSTTDPAKHFNGRLLHQVYHAAIVEMIA